MGKLKLRTFINNFKKEFPQYNALIDDQDIKGLLYMQIGEMSIIVKKLIDVEDFALLDKIFSFFEIGLKEGDKELSNAIAVSFLEHIDFKAKEGILERMPKALREELLSVEEYNKSLLEDEYLQEIMNMILKNKK